MCWLSHRNSANSAPNGVYAPSDSLVRSGDQLRYAASVENKTMLSSAQGLHAAHFPENLLSGSVAPRTFQLYPQEKETLSGDLSVKSGIPSGRAELTQTAGARITYALADSDYAQLVLHLEDPVAATTFTDSSGNIPPHNGQCVGVECPTSQVTGYLGSAVQFDAAKQQVINVPDVDISAEEFNISFWFKTSQPDGGIFSSADASVSLFMTAGQMCFNITGLASYCASAGLHDNKWHFVSLDYEVGWSYYTYGGLPALYVDNQRVLGYWGEDDPPESFTAEWGTLWLFFHSGFLFQWLAG